MTWLLIICGIAFVVWLIRPRRAVVETTIQWSFASVGSRAEMTFSSFATATQTRLASTLRAFVAGSKMPVWISSLSSRRSLESPVPLRSK